MSKFPVAPKPLAQPSTRRFHVFRAVGFVQESSQRSSNISWFDHVQFACASTQSKFETRIYEGKSLSSIMPSVSKVMKVSHLACQEWELKVNSQRYDLMSSKPSDTRSVPMSVRDAAVLERTLRSALESYNFQLRTMAALFPLFWRLRPDSPGAVAFVTTRRGESFLSHMVPSVTEAQKRSLLSDPVFQQEDLFAHATLDAARHAARDVSLYKGVQSRPSTPSGRLRGGPSLRLRHPGDALNLRLLLLPAALSSLLGSSSSRRFTPQKKSPEPPRGFSGVGVGPLAQHRWLSGPLLTSIEGSGSGCLGRGVLARVPSSTPQAGHGTGSSGSRLLQSPVCSPGGFRGVAPHHRPIHPGHLPRVPAISHGDSSVRPSFHSPRRLDDLIRSSGLIPPGSDPSGIASVSLLHHGRSLYQFRVLCFGLTTAPQVFTRLMAPISAILHRYGIRMLRYLDDWLILAESGTTCLQAWDRLLQVCEELGLQVNFRKSSLISSQDMTYLDMQIQSVRFIAKPTETRVENLLKIIEEFLSSPGPPAALWRRLLGHLSSLTLLVKGGVFRMRSLQIRLRSRWDFRDELLRIPWDPLCQEDLLWWSWAIQKREGVDLSLPVPDLSFYSDASDVGWGTIVGEHQVSGV